MTHDSRELHPPCQRPFPEEHLSGYLDRALPQGHAQRVRLHLDRCQSCRQQLNVLATLRDEARKTRFAEPESWPELPQTKVSFWSRSLGWTVILVWVVVLTSLSLWRFLAGAGDPLEIFLVLGLPGGFFLLLVSVAIDRIRDLKVDPYRDIFR